MIIDKNGNKWFKVGLHVHTSRSDGVFSPEAAARRYKEEGFDAVALTDHWIHGDEGELEGLKILSGCEYNLGAADTAVDVIHIVGVGMTSPLDVPRDISRQELIDKINEAGGIAILAHPAWSLNSTQQIESLHGFSALEIYNSVSDVCQSFRPYSGIIVDLLANDGYILPLVATDDTHYYEGEDDCKSFVMVRAESLTRENILNAIRNGDFYASQGPELYTRREGNKIIADFSECVKACFMSNSAWGAGRVHKGECLTHLEYELVPFEKWVRVEVYDKYGNTAWSNIFDFR